MGRFTAPEWRRYADPATEWQVVRVTDPSFPSGMPAPHLRQFTRRADSLLYWSDRAGSRQAFLLDLRAGGSKQLTDAAELDGTSLALSQDEREFFYFDGPVLYESPVLHQPTTTAVHPRQIYRVPEEAVRSGFTVGVDGSAFFVEGHAGTSRIVRVVRQLSRRVFETDGEITDLMARPRHSQLLYRLDGVLWIVNADGSGRKIVKTEPGQTGEVMWTPTGRTLVYLHVPDDTKALVTLREHSPDEGTDLLLGKTSQFISASPNADASVFAGASRSAGSAYVLILLRAARRELTLCEHHASDPRMVNPVFTPDSRNILFGSDRDGKPAIYLVSVVKFVEETGGATQATPL